MNKEIMDILTSKIMEMNSFEQNKVALYLYNSIYSKIKKYINDEKTLDTHKCFELYVVIKGCEIMEENKLVTQNELAIEDMDIIEKIINL